MNANASTPGNDELDAVVQGIADAHSAVLRALIDALDPATAARFKAACSAKTQAARRAYAGHAHQGTIERHFDVAVERATRG